MIFSSLSTPLASQQIIGLNYAVKSFFQYLLQEDPFDEYYFFSQSYLNENDLKNQLGHQYQLDERILDKTHFLGSHQVHNIFNLKTPNIFHKADPYIGEYINLKRTLNHHNIVVTGTTHSLNNLEDFHKYLYVHCLEPDQNKDCIIYTSSSAKSVIENIFQEISQSFKTEPKLPLLEHIPLGVQLPPQKLEKDEAKKQLGLANHHILISYIGRIHSLVKADLCPLLKIYQELCQKFDHIFLLFAGGADEGEIAKLKHFANKIGVQSKFNIVSNFSNEQKNVLYSATDIFVSPVDNYQETFGLSILEAMSYEIPVVCSDWGGYSTIIEHEKEGFLIPTFAISSDGFSTDHCPGISCIPLEHSHKISLDLVSLKRFLTSLIESNDLRRNMGLKGQRKAESYSWQNVIKKHLKLWNKLSNLPTQEIDRQFNYSLPKIFSSYPTTHLTPTTSIRFVKETTIQIPPPHKLIANQINETYINKIFAYLQEHEVSTISNLVSQDPHTDALLIISYLLKYGILEVVKNETDTIS